MKRITILFAVLLFAVQSFATQDEKPEQKNTDQTVYSQMNDWRDGVYRRRVKENLIFLDVEGVVNAVEDLFETDPWGLGVRVGFEHKTRPSTISSRFTIGYGLQLGVTRYFGKDIKVEALGSHDLVKRGAYKSYTEIPLMLNFNWYYNFKNSCISIGLSAGANFMLGQRDVALDYVVIEEFFGMSTDNYEFRDYEASIQQDANNVSLTHIRPTGRVVLGYMTELSEDWRFRIQAGLEYQMGYDDKYSGYYLNTGYIKRYHEGISKDNFTPFLSVGLAYSL